MASPKKKRKTGTKKPSLQPSPVLLPPTPESSLNPSIPDDLLLSCLARVSRLHYPTLSLVSKRFRSLVISPELYLARSLLNRKESCLYVCLKLSPESNPRWFTLSIKPDQTQTNDTNKKKKKKSSGYALAPISIPNSPSADCSSLVTVGSKIYNIGGSTYKEPLSSVSFLDCKSHTWHEAPSMRVERYYPTANVYDGKIYVSGGCEDYNSSNWMEVFDPKTQAWEHVLSRPIERCSRSAVIEEGIYMFGYQGVVYKPKEDKWEAMRRLNSLELEWTTLSDCVIDNVLYCRCLIHGIRWYDSKACLWKNLKGLVGLPKFANYAHVKLADYGGKMAVLWDKYSPSSGYRNKTICCAEIALERCDGDEIWGKVEWVDEVLTVPKCYEPVRVLAATL